MDKKIDKIKFRAENLVRNISTNNVRLIVNADRKARIIIIINATIIAVLVTITGFQMPTQILPETPKVILLLTNLLSLLFALRSVKLFYVEKEGTKGILNSNEYTYSTFDEFHKYMTTVLAKNERVVEYAIRELYMQGILLQRKYYYLGVTFKVFGIGMMTTILVLVLLQFLL
jgi:hypothetical protein